MHQAGHAGIVTSGEVEAESRLSGLPHQLEALGLPPDRVGAVREFLKPLVAEDGALPRRVRMLMAHAAATALGNEREATHALREAVSSGLSRQELLDGLLTCALGRGVVAVVDGLWSLSEAASDPTSSWGPRAVEADDRQMLDFLIAQNPDAAVSVGQLASTAPDALRAYYMLRSTVLDDGALPRKYKELILVVVNATERYERGVEVHLEAAVAAGADRGEVTDALLVATAMGGIPAWHAGSEYLAHLDRSAG